MLKSVIPKTVVSRAQHYFRSTSRVPRLAPSTQTPFITCPKTASVVTSSIFFGSGGVRVVFAPPHSGKTSYIARLSADAARVGRKVEYYASITSLDHLYDVMGVSSTTVPLSHFIPHNTTVIIDQLDGDITDELRKLVRDLAVDSYNSRSYNVVLSISKPALCAAVLSINGGTKIQLIADKSDFMWGAGEIEAYMSACPVFATLNIDEREHLRSLALQAASPGFLSVVASAENPALFLDRHGEEYAANHAENWARSELSRW